MESPVEGALLLQGMLEKRRCSKMSSLVGKSWDQRWFVLTTSSLTYYRSQEDRDWGAAGTVLSLTSLRRFESLSSLVFQLYFYQRILQLRAAHEQETKNWITCLQSIHSEQQVTLSRTAAKPQPSSTPAAAKGALSAPSPDGKSASTAGDGVLIIDARSSIDTENSLLQETDTCGLLPAHLLVEERHVSYSPLSEHAAASPFLSDAHMQLLVNKGGRPFARDTPRQPASTAEAATSTQDEAQMDIRTARRLKFAEPSDADTPATRHQHSQSAMVSSQSASEEAMAVTSRSASYHASSSSPFDHATGGFFAPEDIERLYSLPAGAHPGRLRFTDDLESSQGRLAAVAADTSGGSSPLYVSCSSGSDSTPAGVAVGLSGTAGNIHDWASAMQQPVGNSRHLDAAGTAAEEPLAVEEVQTSRDDRAFWVPEHGSPGQPFTEYTKQQMGSTIHQAAASVQPHELHSVPGATPGKQSHTVTHEPAAQAWTTSAAEADKSAARTGQSQLHQSAHAWASPLLEVDEVAVGGSSGSWQGSFPAEEGPHPPDVPGPYSGTLRATLGFRGGRREDPRLRRFKDAFQRTETEGQTRNAAQTSTAVLTRRTGSTNSLQKHDTRVGSPVSWIGMVQAVDSATVGGSAVGSRSAEFQSRQLSQDLSEVEMFEPDNKQYWRAPPSLAWATLPVASESHMPHPGNVTWAEYCGDSEESTLV